MLLPEGIGIGLTALLMFAAATGAAVTTTMGAGGGVILLLVMAQWIPPAVLIPVHGMVQMGANLGRAGLLWRHVEWPVVLAFLPGVIAGAWLASLVLTVLALRLQWQAVQVGYGST